MMLMKTPTGGGSATGTAGGRDVIFRLNVEPDKAAAGKMRTWGEDMRREQAVFTIDARRKAKEWGEAWTREFEAVATKFRATAQRMAADWNGSMRGLGSPGGSGYGGGIAPAAGGPGGPGGPMNMGMLGSSAMGPGSPMNMSALARANLTQWQRLASANVAYNPMNMGALAGAAGVNWSLPGGGGGATATGGARFGGRNFEAVNNIFNGGAHLARGIAYSGMAGEQDSQKVLDTLLRMEGLLALIHGGTALGKGIGALGIPGVGMAAGAAGAAAIGGVALAGATANDIFGQANRSGSYTRRLGWWNPARWGYAYKNSPDGPEYYNLQQSATRADRQEKNLGEAEKLRQWRMGEDASDFAARGSERSFDAQFRRMGNRGNAAELRALGGDLAAANLELGRAKTLEAEKRAGKEGEDATRRRKQVELEIADINERQRNIIVQGQREGAELALSRGQHNLGTAQQGLSAQFALTQGGASRLRSDQVRFGSLDPLQKMRTESAFAAVRAGTATREQEDLAGGYNAFSDKVDARRAQRGASPWFKEAERDQEARTVELRRRAAEVAEATKIVVEQQHQIILKIDDNDAAKAAAEQSLEIFKELIAQQNRETAKKFDDLRREVKGQERAREINARR